ncbi:MAG: alpha-ketoacid dehydrogenase subunit beta [Deltaproteobacteria bacterium]|nr:alpha-ketoacid dehydrogenase subunit beta [Deltaproteobacteria bacterium]
MSTMTLSAAINDALKLELERDPKVLLLGVDVGFYGGVMGVTAGLQAQFGKKRVRDTPITESAVIGAAVGAAVTGLRPVAELMFVDFIGVALDQLFNQAAKMKYMFGGKAKVPMVMRTCYGAGMGAAAQHSQSLEALFMHIPGIKVVMPSTPYDAKGLLISAIRDDNPVVFLEHKMLYFSNGEVPDESYTLPIGKADVKREGKDLTLVATGQMVGFALNAAAKLSEEGIDVEIVDPRSLSPLDEDTILESVRKTHRLVVVTEEVQFAGSGAEIAAMVGEKAFDHLDAPVTRLGAPFCPIPFSSKLESEFIPNEEKIIKTVKSIM